MSDPPTEEHTLTPEQRVTAQAWIKQKWDPLPPCPFHGPTQWTINSRLAQLPGYVSANLFSGYTFPALMVSCSVCGYMVAINAITAGIVAPDPAEVHAALDAPEAE
jgi:hypothetical protein